VASNANLLVALGLETAEELSRNSGFVFGFAAGLLSNLNWQVKGARLSGLAWGFFSDVITSRHFRMVSKVAKTSTMNPKDLILFSAAKSSSGCKNIIGFIVFTPL